MARSRSIAFDEHDLRAIFAFFLKKKGEIFSTAETKTMSRHGYSAFAGWLKTPGIQIKLLYWQYKMYEF